MSSSDALQPVRTALDGCDEALRKLDLGCCDPGRSPNMLALEVTLGEARSQLEQIEARPEAGDAAIARIEDAGAQIGRLQVTCCTPKRMPLYAKMLEGLTQAQLGINHVLKRGH